MTISARIVERPTEPTPTASIQRLGSKPAVTNKMAKPSERQGRDERQETEHVSLASCSPHRRRASRDDGRAAG